MKCVLFTGITGQLGRALTDVLAEKGMPAACIVRKTVKWALSKGIL